MNPLKQYESNIEQLENLVSALEKGDLSLEEALKHYEKGVRLIRDCQQALTSAEQKIQQLSQSSSEPAAQPQDDNTPF